MAEYQSSRSVLDGYSAKAHRNQQSNLNRTMQVKKQSSHQNNQDGGAREVISKSVLTNGDRGASPIPSQGGVGTTGVKLSKMNIKKTQIRLVNGKRNSIQGGGSSSTGHQSKSVSREGRLKVKLVKRNQPTPTGGAQNTSQSGVTTTDADISRFTSVGGGAVTSMNTSQSPKMSRNGAQRVILATGPSKSTQGNNIPSGVMENSRQREFSPQH